MIKINKTADSEYFGNKKLNSVIIDEGVTNLGKFCFYNCIFLSQIKLPSTLTNLGEFCFGFCGSLQEITIPEGVEYMEHHCFCNCTSLTNINLPNTLCNIPSECFENCTSLSNVVIPEGVTHIETDAIKDCTNLTTIDLKTNEFMINYDNDCVIKLRNIRLHDITVNEKTCEKFMDLPNIIINNVYADDKLIYKYTNKLNFGIYININ